MHFWKNSESIRQEQNSDSMERGWQVLYHQEKLLLETVLRCQLCLKCLHMVEQVRHKSKGYTLLAPSSCNHHCKKLCQ